MKAFTLFQDAESKKNHGNAMSRYQDSFYIVLTPIHQRGGGRSGEALKEEKKNKQQVGTEPD